MSVYTYFSKGQAGVIYRAYKEGRIELTREEISAIYDCAQGSMISSNDMQVADIISDLQELVEVLLGNKVLDYEDEDGVRHYRTLEEILDRAKRGLRLRFHI